MDRSSLSPVKRPQIGWSRNGVWPAMVSMLLVAGSPSSSADSQARPENGKLDLVYRGHQLTGDTLSKPGTRVTPIVAPGGDGEAANVPSPTIDLANFNERFAGESDPDTLPGDLPYIGRTSAEFGDGNRELPGEAAGSVRARRERAVLSPISAFSFDARTAHSVDDAPAMADSLLMQPRADLLSDVPEDYAALAVALAAEEGVDPNWVLSIMRAENAAFDPGLISPAGAIGLMQVMPEIGEAFGADDLTDPEQNIRAGTRFLRVLIDKYRNPVLVASAYNAGEPRVDVHQSVPLIRETADYVTRVVGYYSGAAATSPALQAGPSSRPIPNASPRRTGPAERARSPMLVFTVADPPASEERLRHAEKAAPFGGPVRIVKEEVLQ